MRSVSFITTLGLWWARSLGHGETKTSARESGHYLVCQDLIKVALFCKNSLDEQLMKDVLGIHIVGCTIRFYALVLPTTVTYVMCLLAVVQVPDSIQGLSRFITKLSSILKILYTFDTICICPDILNILASRRAPTLPSKAFQ